MSRKSLRLAVKRDETSNDIKVLKRNIDLPPILKEHCEKPRLRKDKKKKTKRKEGSRVVKEELNGSIRVKVSLNKELFIGCHTSISGGLWKAPEKAALCGAKAFGLFLHSQQQWNMNPLLDSHVLRFRETCSKLGYAPQHIVPHGSYLMNCGSPREDVRAKSKIMLVEVLKRCERLGLMYFNFHPGSTLGKIPVEECLKSIANSINEAHNVTKYVITLLENMSCQGNTVGGKMEELRSIIDSVENKSRVGVCIDTCHAHAAGYDLSTHQGYESLVNDLESVVGLEYVKAFHVHDSKGPCGCKRDRHENIGRGTIGLEGFRRLINDKRFIGIPMIIETPMDLSDAEEIELLYSLKA